MIPQQPKPPIEIKTKASSALSIALGEHQELDRLKMKFFPKQEPKEPPNTIYGTGPRKNIY